MNGKKIILNEVAYWAHRGEDRSLVSDGKRITLKLSEKMVIVSTIRRAPISEL